MVITINGGGVVRDGEALNFKGLACLAVCQCRRRDGRDSAQF